MRRHGSRSCAREISVDLHFRAIDEPDPYPGYRYTVARTQCKPPQQRHYLAGSPCRKTCEAAGILPADGLLSSAIADASGQYLTDYSCHRASRRHRFIPALLVMAVICSLIASEAKQSRSFSRLRKTFPDFSGHRVAAAPRGCPAQELVLGPREEAGQEIRNSESAVSKTNCFHCG
jgi:hypothetical protein